MRALQPQAATKFMTEVYFLLNKVLKIRDVYLAEALLHAMLISQLIPQ